MADTVYTVVNSKGIPSIVMVGGDSVGPRGAKGDPGDPGTAAGFGSLAASVETLNPGTQATVSVSASGPDTEKSFSFAFGIPRGQNGADGHTPVKGVDYWTQQDQDQIVNDVLAALPNSDQEAF